MRQPARRSRDSIVTTGRIITDDLPMERADTDGIGCAAIHVTRASMLTPRSANQFTIVPCMTATHERH